MRKLKGFPSYIVAGLCTILCVFHLYASLNGSFAPFVQRGVHFGCLLPLAFLLYPATKKSNHDAPSVLDYICAFFAVLPSLYVVLEKEYLQSRITYVTPVRVIELVLCGRYDRSCRTW